MTSNRRIYCPRCLLELGIQNSPAHLVVLEELGKFPRRIAPLSWDAEQVDKWLIGMTGIKPTSPDCRH